MASSSENNMAVIKDHDGHHAEQKQNWHSSALEEHEIVQIHDATWISDWKQLQCPTKLSIAVWLTKESMHWGENHQTPARAVCKATMQKPQPSETQGTLSKKYPEEMHEGHSSYSGESPHITQVVSGGEMKGDP